MLLPVHVQTVFHTQYSYLYSILVLFKLNRFSSTSLLAVLAESGCYYRQWRTEGGLGVQPAPPPKFRSFDKVEPDCKLSGKCLVFLFQHPN